MAKEFSAAQEKRIAELMRQFAATQLKQNYIGRGGILPGNISGGTALGDVLTTDSVLDPAWFSPPSARVYCSGGATTAVAANTVREHAWNTTAHNNGCTIGLSSFKIHPFSGGSAVENYIQVPTAGIYNIAATITWYTAGSVYPAETLLFGGASGTTRLVDQFITLNTVNVTTSHVGGHFACAAGDKICVAGYITAAHSFYYDQIYSQLSVSWVRSL